MSLRTATQNIIFWSVLQIILHLRRRKSRSNNFFLKWTVYNRTYSWRWQNIYRLPNLLWNLWIVKWNCCRFVFNLCIIILSIFHLHWRNRKLMCASHLRFISVFLKGWNLHRIQTSKLLIVIISHVLYEFRVTWFREDAIINLVWR